MQIAGRPITVAMLLSARVSTEVKRTGDACDTQPRPSDGPLVRRNRCYVNDTGNRSDRTDRFGIRNRLVGDGDGAGEAGRVPCAENRVVDLAIATLDPKDMLKKYAKLGKAGLDLANQA